MSALTLRPSVEEVRAVVELAGLAPSLHNSQPWHFTWDGEALALREDASRAVPVLDGSGRERLVSCGAALLQARLAFADLGWDARTTLLPDGDDGEVLALVRPTGRRLATGEEHALAAAATRRCTDRDPYDDRPLAPFVLGALRAAAEAEGAWLHVADTVEQRRAVAALVARADAAQRSDPAYLAELAAWRREHEPTGVPAAALPTVPPGERASRLPLRDFAADGPAPVPTAARPVEDPVVVVVGTAGDSRVDALVAGQAVGRVLLRATVADVAAQPVTSVLEVPALREELRATLALPGMPHMVLRLGYGTRGPVTRRLPVEAVLDVDTT
ncbi:MAG: Acg family FMN-binding oxidoreductase [Actinomycetes bacterium]